MKGNNFEIKLNIMYMSIVWIVLFIFIDIIVLKFIYFIYFYLYKG